MNIFTDEQLRTGEWVRKISAECYRGWKSFYHTTAWKKKRREVLRRDHNSCQRCRQMGKYSQAITVHHIKALRAVPELALTNDNLVSLCQECHEAMHPEKHKRKAGYESIEKW